MLVAKIYLLFGLLLSASENILLPQNQKGNVFLPPPRINSTTDMIFSPNPSSLKPPPFLNTIPYSIEWRLSLSSPFCVGLTPVSDTLLWISSGSGTNGPPVPRIYIYNLRTRTRVDSFDQFGVPSGWGWRDMTQKGDTVFASYGTSVDVIHIPTRTRIRSFTPGTGLSVHRGLASDPLDFLLSVNYNTPIWKFYKNPPYNPYSYPNVDTAYGLAYDNQGYLWMSVQYGNPSNGTARAKIAKFSYPNITKIAEQIIPEIVGIAGGCEMWRDSFLLYLNQGEPDEVVCLRLYFPPPARVDLGVDSIISPTTLVNPGAVITPVARIKNFGATIQSNIPVSCWIDSAGNRIYIQNKVLPGPLAPDETASVSFPNWLVGPANTIYQIRIFTDMPDDSNRSNDTTKGTTIAFWVRDTLIVPWRQIIPTLDGIIQPVEWLDALKIDISDVLGREEPGIPRAPGSALFYCKHDSQYVYYAVDMRPALSRDSFDQIGIYVDENYDRTWAKDSSEGNHWFTWIGKDSVIYRAWLGVGGPVWNRSGPGNGLSAASILSGHMQFEMAIEKGKEKWNYNISSGVDTVGLYIFALDQPGSIFYGHWPTRMPGTQFSSPAAYGTVIFSQQTYSVKEEKNSPQKGLKIANPLRIPLILNDISILKIYDVSGKLIREIKQTANTKVLLWDGRDAQRQLVPTGIYFLRIEGKEAKGTKKVVVLQ